MSILRKWWTLCTRVNKININSIGRENRENKSISVDNFLKGQFNKILETVMLNTFNFTCLKACDLQLCWLKFCQSSDCLINYYKAKCKKIEEYRFSNVRLCCFFFVLDHWFDKTKHLKTSPWTQGRGGGTFVNVFWCFVDQNIYRY